MKKAIFLFLIVFCSLQLFTLEGDVNPNSLKGWNTALLQEFEKLTADISVSNRTLHLFFSGIDSDSLTGPPAESAAFLAEQLIYMDRQLKRGVPQARVASAFSISQSAKKQNQNAELPGVVGRGEDFVPPGLSGFNGPPEWAGKPEDPGKPDSPGNSGDAANPGNSGNDDNTGTQGDGGQSGEGSGQGTSF